MKPRLIPNPSQALMAHAAYGFQTELGLNEELYLVPTREPDDDECYEIGRTRAFNLADQEFVGFSREVYQDWYVDEVIDSIMAWGDDEPPEDLVEDLLEDLYAPPRPTPMSTHWPFPTGAFSAF